MTPEPNQRIQSKHNDDARIATAIKTLEKSAAAKMAKQACNAGGLLLRFIKSQPQQHDPQQIREGTGHGEKLSAELG